MRKRKRSTISVLSMADGNSLYTLTTTNKSNAIVVKAMSNGYEVFASTISGFMYMNSSFECKLLPFWKQHHFPPMCGVVLQTRSQPVEGKSYRYLCSDGYVLKALPWALATAVAIVGAFFVYARFKKSGKLCIPSCIRRLRQWCWRNMQWCFRWCCCKIDAKDANDSDDENSSIWKRPPPKRMKWLLPQELYGRQIIRQLLDQLKGKCEKRKNVKITIEDLPASECLAQKDQGLLLFPVINASRVGTDVQTAFDSTRTQDAVGAHEEHTQAVVVVFKSHAPHVKPFPNTQEKLFEMRSQVLGFVDVVFHQNTIYDHKANDAAVDKLFELSKGPKEEYDDSLKLHVL